jgi:hypothetical protein
LLVSAGKEGGSVDFEEEEEEMPLVGFIAEERPPPTLDGLNDPPVERGASAAMEEVKVRSGIATGME